MHQTPMSSAAMHRRTRVWIDRSEDLFISSNEQATGTLTFTACGDRLVMLLQAPADLSELVAFGLEAEDLGLPAIEVGGVIVPGRLAVATHLPGEGRDHNERS